MGHRCLNDRAQGFLAMCERDLAAADVLIHAGFAATAVSRAYFAMYYAACALLGDQQVEFRSHRFVHSRFAVDFARPALVPVQQHRWLLDAFADRRAADYVPGSTYSLDHAQLLLQRAGEMHASAAALLA